MTDLSEVAANVAQALGLEAHIDNKGEAYWIDQEAVLETDAGEYGPANHYWFFRCCEWLHENGYSFVCSVSYEHEVWKLDSPAIGIQCPWAEFPARAVSAVYRHMQEGR